MEEFARAMGLRTDKKTTLIIDGPALYRAERKIGFSCDYKELRSLIDDCSDLHHASYFTGMTDLNDGEHNPLKPLVDWLGWNGFRCNIKRAFPFIDANGMPRVRCNLQSDITVEMLAATECCDTIVLFTDNGDLDAAVVAAQQKNCRVTLVSFREETDSDFCLLADRFVKLEQICKFFTKQKTGQAPRVTQRRSASPQVPEPA